MCSFPDIKFSEEKEIEIDKCAICLDEINLENSVVTLLCKHQYHLNCLFKMLNSSQQFNKCPLCRKQFKISNDIKKQILYKQNLEKEFKVLSNEYHKILIENNSLRRQINQKILKENLLNQENLVLRSLIRTQ